MELYEWQKECLRKWEENHYHGIVNVVTGAGKTILGLSAVSLLTQILHEKKRLLKVKIVVPTAWLAWQWKNSIEKNISDSIGQIGMYTGTQRDQPDHIFMIYVVNSARYSITRHIREDFQNGCDVLLIADECHRYGSPENRKIFEFQKLPSDFSYQVYTLGLSATPECTEYETVLKPALGKEIYQYGVDAAAKKGTISSYRIGQIALSFSSRELIVYEDLSAKMSAVFQQLKKEYPHLKRLSLTDLFREIHHLASEEEELPSLYLRLAYQRAGVSQNAAARVDCAVSLISLLDPLEKILIFCERISQAESLYQRLRNQFLGKVVRYHSELSRDCRKLSLEQFRDGEARILISCKALDEGIDVPSVGTGIVLSSSSQSRQRIQRLGRILRKSEKKNSAVLYYLHIRESADDSAYLPDHTDPSRIFLLEYSKEENCFLNHSYEKLAEKLFAEAQRIYTNKEEKLSELMLCLQQGLVRQNWMETTEYCDQKITLANDQHERNYWICMKRLCSMRKEGCKK